MKKIICLAGLVLLACSMHLTAQTDAETKAWQAYMTPGDVHKMMAQSNGDWTDEITMWMDPAAPPTKATAVSKSEMIMGGRYLVTKTSGDMMGMPFEGMGIIGYDNAKKTFTQTWVDNFGTGTVTMVGTWDNATKSITFKGKGVDPMTGKDLDMRQVLTFIDNDTQQLQGFDTRNGKEVKSMEIKSTRKK